MTVARTARIAIRRPRPDDLPTFLAYRNHPDNMRLQPIDHMESAVAARFLLAQSGLDDMAATGWIMFAIERTQDGALIGEVGMYIDPARTWTGDVGWSLHPDAQGHGYATEAAALLLDHAFGRRGLDQVTASMRADNAASIRVCERLGMRRGDPPSEGEYHYLLQRDGWRG